MDWAERIRHAIDYIETHITEELDYEIVTAQAACSPYYFQRIFTALCGMTMGEYIRQRRLTLAGSELAAGDSKVIDVALKYGYESPESFARAFSKFHGIAPSQARCNGSLLKSFSRLTVQLTLKGGEIMDYRIVEKDAFTLIEHIVTCKATDSNQRILPPFWQDRVDPVIDTLKAHASDPKRACIICEGSPDDQTVQYGISFFCNAFPALPEGYFVRTIPAGTWAIFHCTGPVPDTIEKVWQTVCSEFFPAFGYEPTSEPDIEIYPQENLNAPDYRSEIWVPVRKRI